MDTNNSAVDCGKASPIIEFSKKPGPSKRPIAIGGRGRDAQGVGGLFERESREITQFDELRFTWLQFGEPLECFIESEQIFGTLRSGELLRGEVRPVAAAAALLSPPLPRAIDKYAAHGSRRRGEKLSAVGEPRP